MFERFKNAQLKTKLVGMTLLTLLLLGGVTGALMLNFANSVEHHALVGLEAASENLGSSVAAQYFERYGDVQAFALNPDLQANKRETIVAALNNYVALYLIYDLIMVVDAQGRLVAVNDKGPDGKDLKVSALYEKNYAGEPWFKSTIAGQFTEDKAKGFVGTFAEDLHFDRNVEVVYGPDRLGSSFSAQIKDSSGKAIGVLTNRAGARWIGVAFQEFYEKQKKSGMITFEAALLGRDGTVMFEYDPAHDKSTDLIFDSKVLTKFNLASTGYEAAKQVAEGKRGFMVAHHTQKGVDQVVGFSPIDGPKFTESLRWNILVRENIEEAFSEIYALKRFFWLCFSIVMAITIGISVWFSNSIARRLDSMTKRLGENASQVADAAGGIAQSSTELSEAATEQAAAIQETASAIEQVSAMVKKSSDNAERSNASSQGSRAAAEEGQRAVTEMNGAIQDISRANQNIMSEVEQSNQQISEIVKMIEEIGNKTKVINDIVFQTKLLSFNASVEAARAGEHGKGFAVVAEEVGNLAQMSGNAAKEISTMLDSSTKKVESIVAESRTRVERLIGEGKTKLETGVRTADRCGAALEKILGNVSELDTMVSEIATAGREQSEGVAEINKAINQLDQVTQQNTQVAQMAASSSEQLSSQSQVLKDMVEELSVLVYGHVPATDRSHQRERKKEQAAGSGKVVEFKRVAKPKASLITQKAAGSPEVPNAEDPRFEDV